MQRYSRDRDRDDEGGRSDRGAQARNEERYAQGQRDTRNEFGGRREPDYDRGSQSDTSTYGSSYGSNRWRQSGGDRDRFEQSYGRGGQQSDYYTGGSLFGSGQQREDDYLESRSNWNEQGGRWQPGGSQMGTERRGQYPQYGETEYGVYGPRYAGSGSGQSNYASGGYWGSRERGGQGQRYGMGDERGDDRWNRQGYGQSAWQHEVERGQHHMDPDYLQWREEQIRNLDADYQRYRQERYRKFADEFGLWRRSRESSSSPSGQGSTSQSPMSQSGMGQSAGVGGIGQTSTGNQSGTGSSGGQASTGTGTTGASQDSPKDTKNNR